MPSTKTNSKSLSSAASNKSPNLPKSPKKPTEPPPAVSPKNSRPIPEKSFIQKHFTLTNISVLFLSLIFLLATLMVVADIYAQKEQQAQKAAQLRSVRQQIAYWEDAVRRYKNFRDAYIQLASLEYQLGNMDKAKMYIREALKIDPDSKEALELQSVLNK